MTWQQLLRNADRAVDDTLAEPDAQDMRRVVVAAAQEHRTQAAWWPRPLALAAMLVLMIASGILVGELPSSDAPQAPDPSQGPAAPIERRQLQFSTPGGTRIIWTFNPEFDLKETNP